jgi:DNA-binding XRE family transcriptional regulator
VRQVAHINQVSSIFEFASLLFVEQPVAASDGTLWRSTWAAFLHDLVELKWQRLLPTLCDPATITKTRCGLRLSQVELARAAGISESLLEKIERGERRCTESVAEELWRAMCRIQQAHRHAIPPGVELLFRLEEGDTVGVTTMREQLKPTKGKDEDV